MLFKRLTSRFVVYINNEIYVYVLRFVLIVGKWLYPKAAFMSKGNNMLNPTVK